MSKESCNNCLLRYRCYSPPRPTNMVCFSYVKDFKTIEKELKELGEKCRTMNKDLSKKKTDSFIGRIQKEIIENFETEAEKLFQKMLKMNIVIKPKEEDFCTPVTVRIPKLRAYKDELYEPTGEFRAPKEDEFFLHGDKIYKHPFGSITSEFFIYKKKED